MRDLAFALLALGGVALLILAAAWAIASMRSPDRLHGPKQHGTSGTLGNAFLEIQALFEPNKRHAVEKQRQESADDDPGAPGPDAPSPRPGANGQAS